MKGTGIQTDPFIITSPSEFELVRTNLSSYFELGNDIDFANSNFNSIGGSASGTRFRAHFDGKGYTIKNVNVVGTTTYNGFFGYCQNATIQNVKFDNITMTHNANDESIGLISSTFIGSLSNIHLQGQLNVSGKIRRLGGLIGIGYETVDRLKLHNIYTEIDINFTNAIPVSTTANYVGGVVGAIVNDNTNPSPNVSNILVNNSLSISNPNDFTIGRVVGSRNYQTTYNNVYANISHFPNNYIENFNIVTDATILDPLQLDEEYWMQPTGQLPQLKSFVNVPSGNHGNVSSTINFKYPSVFCESSKSKVNSSLPIQISKASVRVYKQLNTASTISTRQYDVNAHTTNAKIKRYSIDVPFNHIRVDKHLTKSILSIVACPVRRFKVTYDVSYPSKIPHAIYANCYAIKNASNLYTISNPSLSYSIKNQSFCEVN